MSDDNFGGGPSRSLSESLLLGNSNEQSMDVSNFSLTPPVTSHNTSQTKSSSTTPRPKAYPPNSGGPFVVFFRPKGKKLNTSQISKDLAKRFSSLIRIDTVGTSKLRVTVSDRKQANEIVTCELFTLEYRVYLPSNEVEISGVVTEGSLTCDEIKQGSGCFKNPSLPPVQILDCRQMHSVLREGEKKVFSLSDSFCVTFSGSALPDFVVIGKLRLPIRLYVPKMMNCTNCKQLGHTAQYCCNKPRCSSCGERHSDGACKTPPKCVYCNGDSPHALDACPTYIQRRETHKRSLQQRSRRSYAEMLKKAASSIESSNIFSNLPIDDQGSDSDVDEGIPFTFKGSTRKRVKQSQKPSKKPRKLPRNNPQHNMPNSETGANASKRSSPGFNLRETRDFPPLRNVNKIPDTAVFPIWQPENEHPERPEQAQSAPMFTFSGIVDFILNFFSASDSVKNLVNSILPLLIPLLKQLASKMPILETIVSFDG